MHLTDKEIEILKGMRTNVFADGYVVDEMNCGEPWVFAVVDETSINEKTARGVISSLVKKELVEVNDIDDDHNTIVLTGAGKKLFDDKVIECPTPWQN